MILVICNAFNSNNISHSTYVHNLVLHLLIFLAIVLDIWSLLYSFYFEIIPVYTKVYTFDCFPSLFHISLSVSVSQMVLTGLKQSMDIFLKQIDF